MPSHPNKLKVLPPTMREAKRYLLVNVKNPDKLKKALMDFFGVWGWAKAGPQFIKQADYTLVSVERSFQDPTRTALELAGISVLGVSGTINKLKQKFLKGKL